VLSRVADIIAGNVEAITRAWVAELRQTPDTEIHNTLLSHQIVDGVKGMLWALAQCIRAGQAPDAESAAIAAAVAGGTAAPPPVLVPAEPPPAGGQGRYPTLPAPLEQIRRYAQMQGRTRQQQGYEVHEVIQEYIILRRHILETLHANLEGVERQGLELALYLDRILDHLLLNAVKSYHESVIADLERRATRDTMTGLYNHEYCQERLEQEIHRARRRDEPLSLLMIDVDLLKQVNDTYGHTSGDLLLLTVADALRRSMRDTDLICRYGGDEFTIILPNTTRVQAEVLVDRIQAALDQPIALQLELFPQAGDAPTPGDTARTTPRVLQPSASIGLACYPEEARTPQALLAQADAAMYRVKQQRRARALGLPDFRTQTPVSPLSHRDGRYDTTS
jgi:diguanylate cyclase (GGDEF)-like protein